MQLDPASTPDPIHDVVILKRRNCPVQALIQANVNEWIRIWMITRGLWLICWYMFIHVHSCSFMFITGKMRSATSLGISPVHPRWRMWIWMMTPYRTTRFWLPAMVSTVTWAVPTVTPPWGMRRWPRVMRRRKATCGWLWRDGEKVGDT